MSDGSSSTGLLRLADRALWRVTTATTRLGERRGIDWLTYSPLALVAYHRMAARDAPAVASALSETFPEAGTWVDVGAGSGALVAAAATKGVDGLACERSRSGRFLARLQGVKTDRLDLTQPTPGRLVGRFDLAICLEVGEHLPPESSAGLVLMLKTLAPHIVFSAAQPGQGGLGHVNEQPTGYWEALFTEAGARPERALQRALASRLAAGALHADWLPRNVQVFSA